MELARTPVQKAKFQSITTVKIVLVDAELAQSQQIHSLLGPKIWNALPMEVRGAGDSNKFKRCLKTHLFRN